MRGVFLSVCGGADGTSINIKGSKDNVSQLPTVGNSEGDAYLIGGNLYIWDGTNWKDVGVIKGGRWKE